jgi:hypothetical protein
MFAWIYRWYRNRGRAIFRFWDGRRMRAVDPQVAWLALKEHPEFNIEQDPEFHDAGHRDATERVLAATRVAFGVDVFDGETMTGLTEDETLELYWQFGQWVQFVKKNISEPLTSSPTMTDESPNSAESWTAHTNRPVASISTPSAPACEEPVSSLPVPPEHSSHTPESSVP